MTPPRYCGCVDWSFQLPCGHVHQLRICNPENTKIKADVCTAYFCTAISIDGVKVDEKHEWYPKEGCSECRKRDLQKQC